jgi:3D (Asp-Asp-Asp) domain-containing protein
MEVMMRGLAISLIFIAMLIGCADSKAIENREIKNTITETPVAIPNLIPIPYYPPVKVGVNKGIVETSQVEKKKEPSYETFEITSYTSGYESTGKRPSHPQYGVTASGKKVKEHYTAACPKSMPFGTKLYIPYFDNVFTCEDRGGAITEGHIDIYTKSLKKAQDFGRQQLEVRIIKLDES